MPPDAVTSGAFSATWVMGSPTADAITFNVHSADQQGAVSIEYGANSLGAGQPLHQSPVARQHPRVVHPNAVSPVVLAGRPVSDRVMQNVIAFMMIYGATLALLTLWNTDFLGAASKVAQRDGRLVEMYIFAAIVYFLISFCASFLVKRLQAKIAIIR